MHTINSMRRAGMTNPVYFVIDVKINDPEGMKPYQAKVEETFKAFGGERLVAGGKVETLEGNGPQGLPGNHRLPACCRRKPRLSGCRRCLSRTQDHFYNECQVNLFD